jgi:hypothetical protein
MKERKAKRVQSTYRVLLKTDDECEYSGIIENISQTGLFLSCKHKLTEASVGNIGVLYLLPKTPGFEKQVRIVRLLDSGIGLEPLIVT